MRKTIVYVEDDNNDRQLFHEAFRPYEDEYLLTCLSTGEEFFDLLETHYADICLVILDINMPKYTGVELMALMRGKPAYRHIPVVLFSTAEPVDETLIKALGGLIVLKPYSFNGLKSKVAKLPDQSC